MGDSSVLWPAIHEVVCRNGDGCRALAKNVSQAPHPDFGKCSKMLSVQGTDRTPGHERQATELQPTRASH